MYFMYLSTTKQGLQQSQNQKNNYLGLLFHISCHYLLTVLSHVVVFMLYSTCRYICLHMHSRLDSAYGKSMYFTSEIAAPLDNSQDLDLIGTAQE